jgi:hypothetical protein
MRSNLPDLHKQAMALKNKRRLRLDGGRAWIKNGQLHEAVTSATLRMERNDDRKALDTNEEKMLKP